MKSTSVSYVDSDEFCCESFRSNERTCEIDRHLSSAVDGRIFIGKLRRGRDTRKYFRGMNSDCSLTVYEEGRLILKLICFGGLTCAPLIIASDKREGT